MAKAIVIHTEATLDHNTEIDAAISQVAHDGLGQPTEDTTADITMTHCTGHVTDHPTHHSSSGY